MNLLEDVKLDRVIVGDRNFPLMKNKTIGRDSVAGLNVWIPGVFPGFDLGDV